MNILVTGRGTSGSWQIRGEQLGRAMGATVMARAIDFGAFDLAIIVKRADAELVARAHRAGVPLVYDVLDAWPQPGGNAWAREWCMAWLRAEIARVRPAAIVAATGRMAEDCAEFKVPVLALPHHARPGLESNPIRNTPFLTLGYEGAEHYLGTWRPMIDLECARRGWTFVINPSSLAMLDVVVAVRDAHGYAARNWKSNVKLANAMGSGTPVICGREAGYAEQLVGRAVRWADTPREFVEALDSLSPLAARAEASAALRAATPKLEVVATKYRAWLEELPCATVRKS